MNIYIESKRHSLKAIEQIGFRKCLSPIKKQHTKQLQHQEQRNSNSNEEKKIIEFDFST